jgi:purine catabolism regulator
VAWAGAYVCALLPDGDEDDLFGLAERVAERMRTELEAAISIGAGRAVPAGDARRSFHEARCALEAQGPGRQRQRSRRRRAGVATYRDLGSFQLLLSLQDEQALRLFCDSILGPIETARATTAAS